MSSPMDVRPSPLAGMWYPDNPSRLRNLIQSFLDLAASQQVIANIIGLVAPHAGYRYSGRTAGHAFRQVQGQSFDTVVVLSPFHDFTVHPLLTSAHSAYSTPLGEIEVDQDALQQLHDRLANQLIPLRAVKNDNEHALEIELPFLQCALKGPFRLLPLMVRTFNTATLQTTADALAAVLEGRKALLVASTDLSHSYPLETARKLDAEMLRQFEAFDPAGVLNAESNGKAFACGAGAVALTLWTARQLGADRVQLLHYSTSADESGDDQRVVGYGAAAIIKSYDL